VVADGSRLREGGGDGKLCPVPAISGWSVVAIKRLILPLLLRALPLSVMTLWHYIFVLPIVLVMSIPFVFLSIIPIVGMVISTGLTAFYSIIIYRCALTAHGMGNEPDIIKLVKSSLALGFMYVFASLMILIVAVAFAIALSWFGIGENAVLPGTTNPIPWVPASAFLLYMGMLICFQCAMAVPTAALAHAATNHGRDPGVIFGFGQGFFSVLVAWVAWTVAFFYLGFFTVILDSITTGVQLLFSGLVKVPEAEIKPIQIVPLVIATAFLLWGPCWIGATAVLVWERTVKRNEAERVKTVEVARISAEELRALRESRMPGQGQG
jgi:hypothetical protein